MSLLLLILVDAVAGYSLPPSQSFYMYFLLWASRQLYCQNNNNNDNDNVSDKYKDNDNNKESAAIEGMLKKLI